MELVPTDELPQEGYYVPHHAVPRGEDKNNIWMVFNASQKNADGTSLNEVMTTGPKLQTDIAVVLLRWKFFKYIFTSDIKKMFRQILVDPQDRNWLRLVWREEPTDPILDDRLTTVMQGTASAPYLAIRVLQQIAEDNKGSHPEAADLLKNQMYVDDAFGGADSMALIISQRDQLIKILKSAGMSLDKWSANEPSILQGVNDAKLHEVELGENYTVSTLGIIWSPIHDHFLIKFTNNTTIAQTLTKRFILSQIAKLYDPLGWIAPVVTIAKVILQDLWINKLDWDTPVHAEFNSRWLSFHQTMTHLDKIRVTRWIGTTKEQEWHLHGFADASKRMYAAVVYAVIPSSWPRPSLHLLVCKLYQDWSCVAQNYW